MDYIYFDNAATTRTSDVVREEMARAEVQLFYNSAAMYSPSLLVKNEITHANETVKRRLCAMCIQSEEGELIFTSGATESNNMVIFGKILNKQRHHLIVLSGEHSSVFAPAKYLKDNGFEVDFVPLHGDGTADLDAVRRLVKPNTTLFVFGMVNSDTGCMQNTREIVRIVREINKGVHIHCDATQAFCKFNFDVQILGLDSVAICAHKINGPKGIGALWIRNVDSVKATLHPIMLGGGQQPLRPGTENNPAVMGFAKAVETFDTEKNYTHVKKLYDRLVSNLPNGCTLNGNSPNPYIINIQLPNILGQTVMNALSSVGICVGLGSACASTAAKNRTLLAMGIEEKKTKQVIRVSFGVYNTLEEVDRFLDELKKILANLAVYKIK